MKFSIECGREEDDRWFAEVPQLPGVLAYGATAHEALAKAEVLALRVLAERLEHGETRADISIWCQRRHYPMAVFEGPNESTTLRFL
ncbi:MAG: type II toxin-antitoxin system HicB family antitoxin [Gammaproteobacteria bacterium]